MQWFRLEAGAYSNPKQIAAGPEACWLWACCGMYSVLHHTDGSVPAVVLPMLGSWSDLPVLLERCFTTGMLERTDDGVRVVHFLRYNISAQKARSLSVIRSKVARSRWLDRDASCTANGVQVVEQKGCKTSDRIGSPPVAPDPVAAGGSGGKPEEAPRVVVTVRRADGSVAPVEVQVDPSVGAAVSLVKGIWSKAKMDASGRQSYPRETDVYRVAEWVVSNRISEADLRRFIAEHIRRGKGLSLLPSCADEYDLAAAPKAPQSEGYSNDRSWSGRKGGRVDL
jgi:hypothetical protein